jgi:hypothetical protein
MDEITNVVRVNGFGLTLYVSVNPMIKFIYILCKCKHRTWNV